MSNVTMSDIGRESGVTKATVSMVFRNRPGISKATRQRVLEVARNMGYRMTADKVRVGQAHYGLIGVLFISAAQPRVGGQLGGEYLFDMLHGVRAAADKADNGVLFSVVRGEQVETGDMPAALWRSRIDGLVVRGEISDVMQKWLADQDIPCVLTDCASLLQSSKGAPGVPYTQIHIDNLGAMEQVAEHLYARGCRQFATITGELEHINARERLGGLTAALSMRSLSLSPERTILERGFNEESGCRGVQKLLASGASFDALVCQNDLIAYGALQELAKSGLRVPEDVRVTGMDNMGFTSTLATPLTTIDPHPEQIGKLAAKMLMDHIGNKSLQPLSVRVPTQLVVREST